jgi:hypothetical protein
METEGSLSRSQNPTTSYDFNICLLIVLQIAGAEKKVWTYETWSKKGLGVFTRWESS